MSTRELDRAGVMAKIAERRLSQVEAAQLLGVSERQVRRLLRAYEALGPRGLVSRKRGRPSNRTIAEEVRAHAVGLVHASTTPTSALLWLTRS